MYTPTVSEERAPTQAAILEVVRKADQPLAPKEIVARTGLPKGSVQPTLKKMLDAGLLAKPDYGQYALPENRPDASEGTHRGEKDAEKQPAEPEDMSSEELERFGLVRIEQMSVEAAAGDGASVEFEEVEGYEILPAWYVRTEYGTSPERIKTITVRGNSMLPTLREGEKIKVALWDGHPVMDGGVYVLYGPHGLIIKRIEFEAVEQDDGTVENKVWIKADNPEAESSRIPLKVFQDDYRVIASVIERRSAL